MAVLEIKSAIAKSIDAPETGWDIRRFEVRTYQLAFVFELLVDVFPFFDPFREERMSARAIRVALWVSTNFAIPVAVVPSHSSGKMHMDFEKCAACRNKRLFFSP